MNKYFHKVNYQSGKIQLINLIFDNFRMEFDTLYYFKIENNDDLTRKGDINMKNCIEIVEKAFKESSKEKGFSFKINMGERLYHFMTYNE